MPLGWGKFLNKTEVKGIGVEMENCSLSKRREMTIFSEKWDKMAKGKLRSFGALIIEVSTVEGEVEGCKRISWFLYCYCLGIAIVYVM